MRKPSARKSKKAIILLFLLCVFLVLGSSLWVALRQGITLDKITIWPIQIEQITLRVDNGIVLSIDQLLLPDNIDTDSKSNPERIISKINTVTHLFREIRIRQIHHLDQIFNLLLKENQLNISSDKFLFISTLNYENGEVLMDISTLEIKPYQTTLTGTATYVSKGKKLDFTGNFTNQNLSGELKFSQHADQVNAEINTDQFVNLVQVLEQFSLDQELTVWISENINARYYQVEQLKVNLTLQNGKPRIQPDSLSGKAIAVDAKIQFHHSLPPVESKQINISYDNNRLTFDLVEPEYKAKSLAGSSVSINRIVSANSTMDINVQTLSRVDDDILELLETYDVNLPIIQQTGNTRANIHLVFSLPEFTLQTSGDLKINDGNWSYDNKSFHAHSADLHLKDSSVVIDNAVVSYKDIIRTKLKGTIFTQFNQARLTADIDHFDLRNNQNEIITARNLNLPITILHSEKETSINLLSLHAGIILSPRHKLIKLNSLNKIKPFIPSMQNFPFSDGKLSINLQDPEHITFGGFISSNVIPITYDDKPVTNFTFQGNKTPDKLSASINEGKASLTVTDTIQLLLNDYLLRVDTNKEGIKDAPSPPMPLHISGSKSLILLKDISLPTKNFSAELNGTNLSYKAELEEGNVLFQSADGEMNLAASDINAEIAENFFQFADLTGGKFNLSFQGVEKDYEGFVEFSDVLIKDHALLNNILAFINAIPALATLSSPGFDASGYNVNKGVAHFKMVGELLTIHHLRTDGTTINTDSSGWIDLENKILKIDVKIVSLKDYSKIISKIPWAGYALLGEDGSLSTSLLISGNLEKPDITTNLSQEIVMIPFNIITRTIKWPFRLFNKIQEYNADKVKDKETN